MHRLPTRQMLDSQIAGGKSRDQLPDSINLLADVLAALYRNASATRLIAREMITVRQSQIKLCLEVMLNPQFFVHHAQFRAVLGKVDALWPIFTELLGERIRLPAFVEGHGDLRPEHICLLDTPEIFDCLEFNRTLRLLDPYSEITFLGLELAVPGADWIGPQLIASLEPELGPAPDKSLLHFYEALHALTCARARLMPPGPDEMTHSGRSHYTPAQEPRDIDVFVPQRSK